jgi:hypothetical protein
MDGLVARNSPFLSGRFYQSLFIHANPSPSSFHLPFFFLPFFQKPGSRKVYSPPHRAHSGSRAEPFIHQNDVLYLQFTYSGGNLQHLNFLGKWALARHLQNIHI